MTTSSIRERLYHFIETAEEKRVQAIYTIFEDEINQDTWEYTDEFKAELDSRFEYYKSGGKMVTSQDAEKEIKQLLQTGNSK